MKRLIALVAAMMILSCGVALADTATLPADLTVIAAEAFAGDAKIDKVVLPEGVTEIGARAFANSGLREIHLPASLQSIDDTAFQGLTDLTVTAEEGSYAYAWAVAHGMLWCPEY